MAFFFRILHCSPHPSLLYFVSVVGWATPKVSRLPKLEPLGDTGHSGKAVCAFTVNRCLRACINHPPHLHFVTNLVLLIH